MTDKDIIWDNLHNLTTYNNGVVDNLKIFINMNHLQAKLSRDKDSIKDDYKTAKDGGKSPKWRYDKRTGEYCVKIGNKILRPPIENFDYMKKDVDNDISDIISK